MDVAVEACADMRASRTTGKRAYLEAADRSRSGKSCNNSGPGSRSRSKSNTLSRGCSHSHNRSQYRCLQVMDVLDNVVCLVIALALDGVVDSAAAGMTLIWWC